MQKSVPSQIIVFFNSPDNNIIKMVYPNYKQFFKAFDISIILDKFTKPENVIYYQFNQYLSIEEQRYFYATDQSNNWLQIPELLDAYKIYKKQQVRKDKQWKFRVRNQLNYSHRHIHTIQEQKHYFHDPDGLEIGIAIRGRPSRSKINNMRYDNWRSNEKSWKCQSRRPNQWK